MMPEDKKEPSAIVENPQKSADGKEKVTSAHATPESVEIGGPEGPEPTRYGDWEKKGRCIDF